MSRYLAMIINPLAKPRVGVRLVDWMDKTVACMNKLAVYWKPGALKRVGITLLLGGPLALSGCSSFRTEVGNPMPQPSSPLVEGETRVHTVIHELGPPHAISALPDGFAFLYEYSRVSEFQWGLSLDSLRLPYFKIVKGDSHVSESAQILTFNKKGVLTAQGMDAWREKLGSGAALQLVISALSLTDATAFRRVPDALLWGRGLLQEPPVALNAAQDLRGGQHGLQQRIAPLFAGQASLEMPRPNPLKNRRQTACR